MTGLTATQLVQQKLPDQAPPQAGKQGESKFDAVLADKRWWRRPPAASRTW
jgi:hypothetical protein